MPRFHILGWSFGGPLALIAAEPHIAHFVRRAA
jgi:thioesterase domain-containing protein